MASSTHVISCLIIRKDIFIILQVWSGRRHSLISTISTARPINCVAYHPLKEFVITGGWDGKLIIWDLVKVERRAVLQGAATKGTKF